MNLSQYNELCSVCDEILTSPNSSVVTKSNTWLHVVNAHPATQQKYGNIWDKTNKNSLVSVFPSLARFFKNFSSGQSLPKFHSTDPSTKETDVLFISHLINENHLGIKRDFYFGDMALDLDQHDLSSQILLLNHLALPVSKLAGFWKKKAVPRIFLAAKLSAKEELSIFFKLLNESYRLAKSSIFARDGLRKKIYFTSAKAAISFESVKALRFSYQIEHLVKELKPKAIITTMEGHAFERLAFYAARKVNSNIKCFGYHHAILFPHQHAIARQLGPDYDPDIILTAGSQNIPYFKDGYQGTEVKFKNIGTHRYSCPKTIFDTTGQGSESACLVLPDGNISECLDLCRFALRAAEAILDVQFLIRLHPLISINVLISEDIAFNRLPFNLSFSDKDDIQDDFNISKWTLYRGSGAAIHSVMAGCRPIYICSKDSISIDPLYRVDSGRKSVTNVDELQIILRDDSTIAREVFLSELEPLFAYCKKYFMPPNPLNLIRVLK